MMLLMTIQWQQAAEISGKLDKKMSSQLSSKMSTKYFLKLIDIFIK